MHAFLLVTCLVSPEEIDTIGEFIPYFNIKEGGEEANYPVSPGGGVFNRRIRRDIPCIFRAADGLTEREVSRLWDSIALTNLEKDILTALRIIAPGVQGLNLVANSILTDERSPIVKIIDIEEPLPLRNLGDGMQRMLGIALALVNAKDGLLLIDEIENGLHYSSQPDMWRIIFQLARQLNIQVFATCHSWDCIEAFQQAAEEDIQTEGLLIRLEYKNGEVVPTLFDERKLDIVTREQIEVR